MKRMFKPMTTKDVERRRKKAHGRAKAPPIVDGEMIGDGPEKLDTKNSVIVLPTDTQPDKDDEYTISPLRAMLADRGQTIRAGMHVPTAKSRKGVMYGTGLGLSQQAIADIIGISLDTLRTHYDEELKCARQTMMADIQANLYNVARDPKHKNSVQAGMFLLSKLGGDEYREKKSVELSGPNGKPLQIDQRTQTIDPTLLSHDQRDALREILTSAMKLAQAPQGQIEGPVVDGEYEEVRK